MILSLRRGYNPTTIRVRTSGDVGAPPGGAAAPAAPTLRTPAPAPGSTPTSEPAPTPTVVNVTPAAPARDWGMFAWGVAATFGVSAVVAVATGKV